MNKFQPGDLVRIKDGVHEEGMGDKRVALIISEWTPRGAAANPKMKYTSIYNIKMLNGYMMKMHEMFLEIVQEGTNEKEVK